MTGPDFTVPQLSGQRIHPYTDLLAHDMGEGLSDNRPDFPATGKEWRHTLARWGSCIIKTGFHPTDDGTKNTADEIFEFALIDQGLGLIFGNQK